MKMRNCRRIAFAALACLVLAALAAVVWHRWASRTRIAFVNYPEYILAPLLDQEINPAIEVVPLKWSEKSGAELKDFDFVIFFGMGLNFTAEQQEILKTLKTPVYTTASTRSETALATMTPQQRKRLEEYLRYGGKRNFRRMLDYIRYAVDGKRIRAPKQEPPAETKPAAEKGEPASVSPSAQPQQ